MALSYTTTKWVELAWWISWSQHTNLIEDRSFHFISVLFFDLLDVGLVNSFIVYKNLENKYLTLKEFKICIALKLISSFVSQKQTIAHPSAPKLKDPTRYLHHICQFSWRQDDDLLYAPKQENRTEHLLRVHYVM